MRGFPVRVEGFRPIGTGLGALDRQIHYDRLLAAAHHYGFHWFIGAGVDLLVWYERRNVDEISGTGFVHELKAVAPAETCPAAHDVEHGFQLAMMMCTSLHVRLHHHRSRP